MDDETFHDLLTSDLGKLAMCEARHAIKIQGGGAFHYLIAKAKRNSSNLDQNVYAFASEIVRRYRWTNCLPSIISMEAAVEPARTTTRQA